MTPEEKSKYTNRAREVWDKYLSTTPARIPKPRRQVFSYSFPNFCIDVYVTLDPHVIK